LPSITGVLVGRGRDLHFPARLHSTPSPSRTGVAGLIEFLLEGVEAAKRAAMASTHVAHRRTTTTGFMIFQNIEWIDVAAAIVAHRRCGCSPERMRGCWQQLLDGLAARSGADSSALSDW